MTASAPQHTTSADGTTIAYEAYGIGPAVLIVGGAFCDRNTFRDVAQTLGESGFTGVTYDRRGRGDSTDTQPYTVAREVEDIAAVIEATGGGSPAFLHGISSGGALVLHALAAGLPVARASVLEVPYRDGDAPPAPENYIGTLEDLQARGDREGILRLFHTVVVGMPESKLEEMRGKPVWDAMLALTYTVRYDGLCLGGDSQPLPLDLVAGIDIPVLTLCSSGTMLPWMHDAPADLAAALPHGSTAELPGEFHQVPAPVLAPVLAEFYRG